MNRTGTRILAAVLLVCTAAGFAYAAASQEGAATAPQKVKITYWKELNADKLAPIFKSLGESELYKELQKRLNVDIEFLHAPSSNVMDQFNLIVASQDLPDIMEFDLYGRYPGGAAKAIADGVTQRHNEIFQQYAPNLSALWAAHPEWTKQAKLDDGSYYGFPFIRGNAGLAVWNGPMFRQDWLAELGLKPPTTIDEWYTTLKAFKDRKGIEYPFSFRQRAAGQDGNDLFFSGSISGAWGVNRGFYLGATGDVEFGPIQPGWREFVRTMAQWFKEGLIDPDFPVHDTQTWRAKVMSGKTGAMVTNVGGGMGFFYDNVKKSNPTFALVGVPDPVLRAGQTSRFGQRDWDVHIPGQSFITPKNRNVAASARFLDYGYGKEGDILFNFGIEGVSFNWVNGYPRYTDAVTKDPNYAMAVSMSRWMRSHYDGPFVQRIEYFEQFMAYPDQVATAKTWGEASDFTWRMPRIAPTAEESTRLAGIMNEINVYTDEMLVKFVMGQVGLDQWDAYLAQVKRLRIDEALAIQRAALERYNRR
jgi:putative aldouronate transport system substrate-binding protein